MKKEEADFGMTLRHWLMANPLYTSALELKQTETDSIAFSEITDDQLNFLRAIHNPRGRGLLIRTKGVRGLPDYVYLRSEPAYIVIQYPMRFCIIEFSIFEREKNTSKSKSLTSERATVIAFKTVKL